MATMRVAQIPGPKGKFEIVERPIPPAGPGTIRIKVSACGICHSDSLVTDGLWPGIQYPRVPGHEVAGHVDAIGAGVTGWAPGQLVGVGWHGGYCGRCNPCRRGELWACETQQVTGISFDCGYGGYMIAPVSAAARTEYLSDQDAAKKSANFLFDEIGPRLAKEPAKFQVFVQMAESGDDAADASVPWPDSRMEIPFGAVALTARVDDQAPEQRRIIFDPLPRIEGIDCSGDPLTDIRSDIHLMSGRRRRAASSDN